MDPLCISIIIGLSISLIACGIKRMIEKKEEGEQDDE
jgi:cytochrome c biogenesis protein ResB